jgi:hypothetical protein
MSYSNPVIKEIIRERLTDMVLKRLQEASNLMSPADALKQAQRATQAAESAAGTAGAAGTANAAGTASAAGTAGTPSAGSPAASGFRAAAREAGKKLYDKAATIGPRVDAEVAKYAMTNAGKQALKYGKIVKVGAPLIGAALQGLDSASTEWNENKEKGLGDTENAIKTGVRGTAGAVGAGVGVWGGAAAGAAGGAIVGSVVPFVGTAIGGLVGGIVGGIAGGMGGGWLGDKVGDAVTNIGENPAAQRKFKQDAKNAENDEKQKRADDRWSSKFGSSSDNGFGDAPRPGGNGQRSNGGSYRGRGGRGQSQEFSIGGAGSVDFSASQTQWDNSNYNGSGAGDGGGQGGGGGGGGRGAEGENPSSNGVTRYPTPGIDLSEPVTVDSLGPAKKDLVTGAKKSSTTQRPPQDLTHGLAGLQDAQDEAYERSKRDRSPEESAAMAAVWEARFKRNPRKVDGI